MGDAVNLVVGYCGKKTRACPYSRGTLVIQLLIDAFLWPFGATLAFILAASGGIVVYLFIRATGRLMRGLG